MAEFYSTIFCKLCERSVLLKKRVLSVALVLSMLLSLMPTTAFAAKVTPPAGKVVTYQKDYAIVDGVTESHVYLNTTSGNAQVAAYMTTVEPTAKATFKATYADYYTAGSTVESRKAAAIGWNKWKLMKPTQQAANYEAATGGNVIMCTNADYFNMQTGQPLGYLVMEGNVIQTSNGSAQEPYFAVLKDGSYVIRDYGTDHSDVLEAISGPFYLVKDGVNVAPMDYDLMPRNSIGVKPDGSVVTIMVDGRQSPYSVGMSIHDLADLMVSQGVDRAIYLDGGGSAMVASKHEGTDELVIRNRPSDGTERSDSSCLLLVSTAEASTAFDHASINTAATQYTPGSQIVFEAVGVSSSGAPAVLPTEGLTWEVDAAMGTAGEAVYGDGVVTGTFTSNGTVGEATMVLKHNGVKVGEGTVSVVEPDELYFASSAVSLDFGESSKGLGLVARVNMSEIVFKDDDFTWTIKNEAGEPDASVGTVVGNTFTSGSDSVKGSAEVSYTKKDGTVLTASVDLEIGKLPVVAFDFEAVNGEPQKAAHYHWGKNTFVNAGLSEGYTGNVTSMKAVTGGVLYGDAVVGEISAPYAFSGNFEAGVPASDIFRANGYTYYLWPNNSITSYNTGTLSVVTEEDGGQVRFGDYSLELNYDFRSFDFSSNSNWYIRYCGDPVKGAYPDPTAYATPAEHEAAVVQAAKDSTYYIEGHPTSLGVWVYADQLSQGFMVAADVEYWTGSNYKTANLFLNHKNDDGTESNRIDWVGWKYCYANITDAMHQGYSPEHPFAICPGRGIFWFSYQPGNMGIKKAAGTIYFDNYRFVYGADFDDLDNPAVHTISVNGKELSEEETISIDASAVEIKSTFADVDGRNVSGVNASKTTIKVDGAEIPCDGDSTSAVTRLALSNGLHSVQVTVYDQFGNYGSKTCYVYVDDAGAQNATVSIDGAENVTMGCPYELTLSAKGDVQTVEASITQLNADFGEPQVTFADGWTGTAVYTVTGFKRAKLEIQAEKTGSAAQSAAAIATISFQIPTTVDPVADFFTYQLTGASGTLADGSAYSAAQPYEKLSLSAYYTLTPGIAVAGNSTTLTVTDVDGKQVAGVEVYVNDALIGTTDENGQITTDASVTLAQGQTFAAYASKDGSISFTETVTVVAASGNEDGTPTGVVETASKSGNDSQTISWFSNVNAAAHKAIVKYSTSEDMSGAVEVEGTSTLQQFSTSKQAALINAVSISGLEAGTTYYYQAGDGEHWSEVRTFKTAPAEGTMNFFVIGDTQMSGNVETDAEPIGLLNKIASGVAGYDFGIQTGDYVDNGGNFNMWEEIQNVFGTSFKGIDMVHATGNHEYYGDADGDAAGLVYNLKGTDRLYYSVEYGNVYIALINLNANLAEALEWMVQDAQQSDADWKVMAVHQPAYYTNVNGGSTRYNELIPAAADAAGLDIVFSGHDHSYARTKPMTGGQVDEENGVVYFICGDLGEKSRDINYAAVNTPEFNFDFINQEYDALYLDVQASAYEMSITAKDSSGNIIDSTKLSKACASGHQYEYFDKGMLHCGVCGRDITPAIAGYTGFINLKDSEDQMYFIAGNLQSGWFQVAEDMYHANSSGIAHKATTTETRTCTTGGYNAYHCAACDESKTFGSFLMPGGHDWATDEAGEYLLTEDGHRYCSVCDKVGISLDEVTFNFGSIENPRTSTSTPRYVYKSTGIRPSSFGTYDGVHELTSSNDDTLLNGTMRDLYVTWPDSNKVGEAKICYTGRGDYYGERELTYIIIPRDVSNLTATAVTDRSVTLSWAAQAEAGYYQVYTCDESGANRKLVATSETPSCVVKGLESETTYYFVAAARTSVNDVVYSSSKWSNVASATTQVTPEMTATVDGITATVDGQTISAQDVNGKTYLFLPASADLSALTLCFDVSEADRVVTVTGSKGDTSLESYDGAVDLTAIAAASNGAYEIDIALDGTVVGDVTVMKGSQIPTMYLTSDDAENAGRDFVDASKENVVTGSMVMIDDEGSVIYDGALTQLKARGNSTFTYCVKKSYQIKLETKTDLMGNGEKVKTVVLLAGYDDATKVHDKTIKDLADEMGLNYVASTEWVNLFYDGEYRGIYTISEKNSVGSTSVDITDMEDAYASLNEGYGVDVQTASGTNSYGAKYQYTPGLTEPENITGGYLLELNGTLIDEASGFKTVMGKGINVKSPEWTGEEAMQYISEYFQEFENAVYAKDGDRYTGYNEETGKYYYEYCDRDSLVKAYLLKELCLNPDGFYSSLFFYKDANDTMYCGPIWDQEVIFGTGWTVKISPYASDTRYLVEALVQIPDFQEAVRDYYNETFGGMAADLTGSNGVLAQNVDRIYDNVEMDHIMWPLVAVGDPSNADHLWPDGTTYQDVVDAMLKWVETRVGILDDRYEVQKPDIEEIKAAAKEAIDAAVDGDTAENVLDVANAAKEAIDAAETIEEVIAARNAGIQAIEAAKAENEEPDEPTPEEPEDTNDVDTDVTVETDEEGNVVANIDVTTETVTNAMDGNEDKTVVLNVSASVSAKVAALAAEILQTIMAKTNVIGEGQKAVEIKLPEVKVGMDASLLGTLTVDPSATVKIGVEKKTAADIAVDDNKTAAQQNTVAADTGVKAVLDINLTVGNSAISNLGGKMSVTVPKPAGVADKVFAYCLRENGEKEVVRDCEIIGSNVIMKLSHLSTYVLTTEDPTVTEPDPVPGGGGGGGSVAVRTYTLTFKSNGGSSIKAVSEDRNTVVDLSDYVPTKAGYTFAGWYSDAALKNAVSSVKLTSNTTVYAKWVIENTFTDVAENAYYYDAVLWAVGQGITNGLTETTFVPNAACTRAQMVTFLWRAAGSPEPAGTVNFTDVAADAYYAKAVAWAAEQGITQGTSATTFSPNATVSRAQVVAFLYRADKADTAATSAFTDVPADAYYANAVAYAAQKGITDGVTATTFAPNSPCSRAQIVTFLFRDYGK